MRDNVKLLLGLGALGAGGYLLITRSGLLGERTLVGLTAVPREDTTISPGHINIEVPPLVSSDDPLRSDVPQAGWAPAQAAAYYLARFLDAYERYALHRHQADLTRMRTYVMRLQGAEYSHLTRSDLWTADQLRRLVTRYRWEYGIPWKKIIYPEDKVKRHFLVAGKSRCACPQYATSRGATVRDIVTQLLYDAQAGRLYPVPAIRAIALPWYTVAQAMRVFDWSWSPGRIQGVTYTYEWIKYWERKGLRIEYCGKKGFRFSSHGYHTYSPPGEFLYYCVK